MRLFRPLVGTVMVVALAAPASAAALAPATAVRVEQLGFAPGETKVAYLFARSARPNAAFAVIDGSGKVTSAVTPVAAAAAGMRAIARFSHST